MMVARECQLGLLQEKRISSYLSSLDDDDDELVTAILLLYVVHLYHVRRRDRKWTRDSSLPSNDGWHLLLDGMSKALSETPRKLENDVY